MGRGITRICSMDGARVNTFIINLHGNFEERKRDIIRDRHEELSEECIREGMTYAEKRRAVLHLYMEGRLPITVTDEYVYNRMSEDAEDEIGNIACAVAELDGFERLAKREYDERLSSAWHECGVVIAKSKNCMLVIADNESDFVIGCVPTETIGNILDNVRRERYEELYEEAEAELEKTRKRADANYEITSSDVRKLADEKVESIAAKEWDEFYYRKFRPDANAAMRKVHEWMDTRSMHVPTSAWTSSKMPHYGYLEEEERNQYY